MAFHRGGGVSVINQMLRDLDARGQGDGAGRRAALASVGQPVAQPRSLWRSRGLWWLIAAATVALAATATMLVLDRWRTLESLAEAGRDRPATERTQALVDAAAIAHDPLSTPPSATASAEEAGAEPAVPEPTAPAPAPVAEAALAAVPTPVVDPVAVAKTTLAPVEPTVAPEPMPSPASAPAAPAARATIERVATAPDPLDAARSALAEGRADAALAALAEQPTTGAERDALEAAALQQLGRHADAEQAYRRALQREPDIGAWWAGLGIALDASGRGDEALVAFREAQRRGPLDPALADYLGERVEALSAGEPSR